jgi:hypothetical protein
VDHSAGSDGQVCARPTTFPSAIFRQRRHAPYKSGTRIERLGVSPMLHNDGRVIKRRKDEEEEEVLSRVFCIIVRPDCKVRTRSRCYVAQYDFTLKSN